MRFIDLVLLNKLEEAKQFLNDRLEFIIAEKIEQYKSIVAEDRFEEYFDEAKNPNIIKMGRIKKIRRRIRRNAKGRIVVQRNVRKSAIKGYRLSGNTVKRVPAIQRINKARKLKRYWKTKGKAKLGRTLLKRKMSIRRRQSMGIR